MSDTKFGGYWLIPWNWGKISSDFTGFYDLIIISDNDEGYVWNGKVGTAGLFYFLMDVSFNGMLYAPGSSNYRVLLVEHSPLRKPTQNTSGRIMLYGTDLRLTLINQIVRDCESQHRICRHPIGHVMITSLSSQSDIATSFWRNNDVVITSCVRWMPWCRKVHLQTWCWIPNVHNSRWRRHRPESTLAQVMAWRLTKTSPKPMLTSHQWGSVGIVSIKVASTWYSFMIIKTRELG